jgi:hypothetical protein
LLLLDIIFDSIIASLSTVVISKSQEWRLHSSVTLSKNKN